MKEFLDSVKIGENIKELRVKKNWSQEELASKLFISRKAVSKWENGQGVPSIDLLLAMANLFEVSIEKILGKTENGEKEKNETPVVAPYRLTRIFITSIIMVILFFLFVYWATTFNKFRVYSIYSTNAQITGNYVVAKHRRIFNINSVKVSDNNIANRKYYDADYQIMMNDELILGMGDISTFKREDVQELKTLNNYINDISAYIIDDLPNLANPIKNDYSIKIRYIDENYEEQSYVIKFKMNEFFANNQIFYENYDI